jgi:hypothetical protein
MPSSHPAGDDPDGHLPHRFITTKKSSQETLCLLTYIL